MFLCEANHQPAAPSGLVPIFRSPSQDVVLGYAICWALGPEEDGVPSERALRFEDAALLRTLRFEGATLLRTLRFEDAAL